jgi:hypothetical protein
VLDLYASICGAMGQVVRIFMKKVKYVLERDVILDAFLKCLDDRFVERVRTAKIENWKVFNPHFWEKSEFISLDYIDKNGNIFYTRTQPGVPIGDYNHTIQSVVHYEDYKPYHDRWVIQIERDRKIGEIF